MFGSKTNKPQNRIDCLIGAGTTVEGDIRFVGGLRVDGNIKGNVMAAGDKPATLVLSEAASIEGEIHVSHVVINGSVRGPVHSTEYVELQGKASVTGDIHYKTIEVHLGAIVAGRMVHQDAAKSDKVVALKPATGD